MEIIKEKRRNLIVIKNNLNELKTKILGILNTANSTNDFSLQLLQISKSNESLNDILQPLMIINQNLETNFKEYKTKITMLIDSIIQEKLNLIDIHLSIIDEIIEIKQNNSPKMIKLPFIGLVKLKDTLMTIGIIIILLFTLNHYDSNAMDKTIKQIKTIHKTIQTTQTNTEENNEGAGNEN